MVKHYRLYRLGPDGHFQQAIDLECEDDSEAETMAERCANSCGLELWSGARKVREIPARHPLHS